MTRLFPSHPTPEHWRKLLADPDKHWQAGFSAHTLAHAWLAANGFPPEVAAALASANDPLLADLVPVRGEPEFKVPLPGGKRASQNDIFVLARSASGPVAIMVEGKVDESFGPILKDWLQATDDNGKRSPDNEPGSGKALRLDFLLRTVGLAAKPDGATRYQLLHRAASAVLTGEQQRAVAAILLVHSFSERNSGWDDFKRFCELFGTTPTAGRLERLPGKQAVPLFAVWVAGDRSFRKK